MAKLYQFIINKLRYKRFGLATGAKLLTFGGIYSTGYSNWAHDSHPLIWVQFSGPDKTHAINVNYLNRIDKAWLANTIYIIKKAHQIIDGRTFYTFLKQRRPSIVKAAYRMYFTSLLNVKLVSAGITPLDKMIYTTSQDPWVLMLNEAIKPSEMAFGPSRIAYTPTELRDRIIGSMNSTDIRQSRVGGAFGKAQWAR